MQVTIEDHFELQKQVMVDGVRVGYLNTATGGVVFLPQANRRRARVKARFTEQEVLDEVRRLSDGITG